MIDLLFDVIDGYLNLERSFCTISKQKHTLAMIFILSQIFSYFVRITSSKRHIALYE